MRYPASSRTVTLAISHPRTVETATKDDPRQNVVEVLRLIEMPGDLSEGQRQLGRRGGSLSLRGGVGAGDRSPITINGAPLSLLVCPVTRTPFIAAPTDPRLPHHDIAPPSDGVAAAQISPGGPS